MQPFCPCSRALNWTGKGLRSDTYLKLLPLFGIRKFCPNLACLIIVPVWPCLCIVKMSWPVELLQIILRLKWVDVDDPHTMTHWSFVHPHQWFSCVAIQPGPPTAGLCPPSKGGMARGKEQNEAVCVVCEMAAGYKCCQCDISLPIYIWYKQERQKHMQHNWPFGPLADHWALLICNGVTPCFALNPALSLKYTSLFYGTVWNSLNLIK